MFQFLGDPHLTISHVNYKLDQVHFWRYNLRFYHLKYAEDTLILGSLSTVHTSFCLTLYFSIFIVSVAVSFSDGGGRNYKITEGKNCLWGSSPGNVNSVWSTVLLVEHERERLDWRITTGFTRGSTVGASWRKWLEIWSVQKVTLCVVCATLDPRLSDPGDGVQAQLWGASSRTHGLRKVSQRTLGKTLIQVLKLCLHLWGRLSTVL